MTTNYLLPRVFGQDYPRIVRAEGIRLWDAEGHEYIDSTSGAISVVSVGHGRREVADAIAAQVLRMDYVHDNEFHNEPAHALAEVVTSFAGGDFSRAVFFSSGSEAIESAIKLAHDYHRLQGNPARATVIGRKRSFHGATMFAMAAGDVSARKSIYGGYVSSATAKVPAPYCYRCPLGLRYPDCALACADELERTIQELGPDNVSAFIAEPIVGAAAPALTPPAGYYERIREICDRYGVLWIADEIVTGFGRTGLNMGYQHWNAQPDILVVAKGLSGGYIPLSGLIISERGCRALRGAPRALRPRADLPEPPGCLCCRARRRRDHRAGRSSWRTPRPRANTWRPVCVTWRRACPWWASSVARASCGAWSSSRIQVTKEPFPRALSVGRRVYERGLHNGLVIYQSGGSVYASDEVFISPPLVVSRADIDEIVERFGRTLEEVQAEVLEHAPAVPA